MNMVVLFRAGSKLKLRDGFESDYTKNGGFIYGKEYLIKNDCYVSEEKIDKYNSIKPSNLNNYDNMVSFQSIQLYDAITMERMRNCPMCVRFELSTPKVIKIKDMLLNL